MQLLENGSIWNNIMEFESIYSLYVITQKIGLYIFGCNNPKIGIVYIQIVKIRGNGTTRHTVPRYRRCTVHALNNPNGL